MTLQQFNYAIAVAETGSMNMAAEMLFISQSALTYAIKSLEQEAGITIFNRTSKGVQLTNEGAEFLRYARQVYEQYELLQDKYAGIEKTKRIFRVSTQHYSFAVKAFVETVKKFDSTKYEFSILETQTRNVIQDVGNLRSEIGILYLSDFNRRIIEKMLLENELEFHKVMECRAYVYLWKNHPLAGKASIKYSELLEYPNLSFEQGEESSFYLGEEILGERDYPYTIKANDRSTMLNLMVGLNGYTLCSGIICEELNGSDFAVIPFEEDEENHNSVMEIGYIVKKQRMLSEIGEAYIEEIRREKNDNY